MAVLVLDPMGSAGNPEVVYLTAHTSTQTTGTIARAQEGSTARQHLTGIPWVHGETILDFGTPVSTTTPTLYNPLDGFVTTDYPFGMTSGSTAVGVANTAYLMPMRNIFTDLTVTKLIVQIATTSGNIDAGIYSWDGTTMTRIVSLGSTASPGNGTKYLDIADTIIYKGTKYFLAWAADNATIAVSIVGAGIINPTTFGGYTKVTSFPLPATITTLTANSTSTQPVMYGLVSGGSLT